MGFNVPAKVSKEIRELTFAKAEACSYGSSSRVDNGAFIDRLVQDKEIGGRLREFLPTDKIRTYIKDAILNAYSKQVIKNKLGNVDFGSIVKKVYGKSSSLLYSKGNVRVYRSEDRNIFLITAGTYLKWESALRRLLEFVANNPQFNEGEEAVNLCLTLVTSNAVRNIGDEKLLKEALKFINIQIFLVR